MIETMVKNGQPVPDYIFKDNGAPEESSMQMLRNGLIYIAIGIGLAIALWGFGLNDAIGIASIPALVGCAYLVAYFVARGKKKHRQENQNPTTRSDPGHATKDIRAFTSVAVRACRQPASVWPSGRDALAAGAPLPAQPHKRRRRAHRRPLARNIYQGIHFHPQFQRPVPLLDMALQNCL